MIGQRMPNSNIFGSAMKGQVTACRKRLRVSRIATRHARGLNHAGDQVEDMFPEATTSNELRDHAAPQKPAARIGFLTPSFAGTDSREGETLLVAEEQEAGIA